MSSILDIAKNMSITHNVSINVYDEITGQLIKHHEGHNAATNSMLVGIGHYLLGEGILNQGADFLDHWIPKYISLGTMGLYSQDIDLDPSSPDYLLPTGIGYSPNASEEANFTHYINHVPGFGADGYDPLTNPGREYNREFLGIGPIFKDRVASTLVESINTETNTRRYHVSSAILQISQVIVSDLDGSNPIDKTSSVSTDPNGRDLSLFIFSSSPGSNKLITITYTSKLTTNCELISDTFPRAPISYRRIIPEEYAEMPKTIDLIFSAMISTGAMKEFRDYDPNYPENKNRKPYVLISEAGLWSRNMWPMGENGNIDYNSGDNGLLAGYRILPPDDNQQDMTDPVNRKILKEQILRVGYNQVVQVVWKIQLGSVSELFTTQPEKESIKWEGFT